MSDLTVVKWIHYKDAIELTRAEQNDIYFEALRKEIVSKNIKIKGDQHQNCKNGVPLFSDGTVWISTFRSWGGLMAEIWSQEENKEYSYMDFYVAD